MAFNRFFERLGQDFGYGVRVLRLNPGFAATAILSLALGIAANTSIFTLTDQILLRLLPVQDPRELVQFRMEGGRVGSQNGDGLHTFSYPMYVAFRDRNTVFSGLTGQYTDRLSLLAGDRGEMVEAGWVAGNFFQVLGVKPFIGRVLTAEDDRPEGGAAVVVLQHAFWQSWAPRSGSMVRRSPLSASPRPSSAGPMPDSSHSCGLRSPRGSRCPPTGSRT
jgi:putative ABC transport system permease protein